MTKSQELVEKIASHPVGMSVVGHNAAEYFISLCRQHFRTATLDDEMAIVGDYVAETQGRIFLLDKGYKPALEKLVIKMGWSEEHHGNRILVTIPEAIDNLRGSDD